MSRDDFWFISQTNLVKIDQFFTIIQRMFKNCSGEIIFRISVVENHACSVSDALQMKHFGLHNYTKRVYDTALLSKPSSYHLPKY